MQGQPECWPISRSSFVGWKRSGFALDQYLQRFILRIREKIEVPHAHDTRFRHHP
jgi:hypothetical protein